MKFLIDGSSNRIAERKKEHSHLITGQLLTPLTKYKRCEPIFAIDNGAYSGLDVNGFTRLLKRSYDHRHNCLFVAIPDKVADHKTTMSMWCEYHTLADGYKKAFVAQDGMDCYPSNADALFVGGTDDYKNSNECAEMVKHFLSEGKHVHIGRVNTFERFHKFKLMGANTCDGSGISKYDHMIIKLNRQLQLQWLLYGN